MCSAFQHFPSCLMYAGFKRIAPDQNTGMDLNEPWITALELFHVGKRSARLLNVNNLCLTPLTSLVRLLTFFGARLLSSNPFIPPTAYLNSHLCPVLRVIPNSSHSSLTVNRPLCAKLINRCFCSIGISFFQGILPSLCVTHVLGHFVTDLLGSYQPEIPQLRP